MAHSPRSCGAVQAGQSPTIKRLVKVPLEVTSLREAVEDLRAELLSTKQSNGETERRLLALNEETERRLLALNEETKRRLLAVQEGQAELLKTTKAYAYVAVRKLKEAGRKEVCKVLALEYREEKRDWSGLLSRLTVEQKATLHHARITTPVLNATRYDDIQTRGTGGAHDATPAEVASALNWLPRGKIVVYSALFEIVFGQKPSDVVMDFSDL